MRDRLIEIFKKTKYSPVKGGLEATLATQFSEYALNQIIDKLLAEGVIVPPVKVGDKMYFDGKHFANHCAGEIMERRVDAVLTEVWATFRGEVDLSFDFEDFGKTVFLTREEAEKALNERSERE